MHRYPQTKFIKNLEQRLDVMEQLENLIEIQEDSTISAFGSDVL